MKTGRRAVLADALKGALKGALSGLLVLPFRSAAAAPHTVAPGQSLSAALKKAADGDEIHLLAGEHRAQVAVIEHKRLTLRGVGGRPVLLAAGAHAEGKAILVVRNGDVLIDNIEFRGARVPSGNGAGIRFERGHLRVNRCAFFDNQMGLLTSNFQDSELNVSDSEFGQAPERDSTSALPHLLYVGRIARLTLTGSRLSGGNQGHLVKSRALENHVRYNQLVDGVGGQTSYELEFPNGGIAFVVGNVVSQSETTRNNALLSFGAEGSNAADGREHALHVVNNTFINHGLRPAIFVRVHETRLAGAVEQRLVNNLFLGLGMPDATLADPAHGNFVAPPSMLQGAELGQYTLHPLSALRGQGVAPGTARGVDLRPLAEFRAPVGTRMIDPLSSGSSLSSLSSHSSHSSGSPPKRCSPGAYQN